ncbi:MAG: pantetheine-phosphate adenylyltransferase [Candidatus Zixiibacteriota bacterium]
MSDHRDARRGLYPGTFDPVTNGHLSLIERACHIFDEVIVALAVNVGKEPLFTLPERLDLMRQSVSPMPSAAQIRVVSFDGLLADFVREQKATAIIRGLRAVSDFEYEFQMALMNRKLAREAETVFLMPALSWVYLSSSIVKDVAANRGDVSGLVPDPVAAALLKKFPRK